MRSPLHLLMVTVVALAACGADGDPITSVAATGTIGGLAYVDRDGDGLLGQDDTPLPGIGIRVVTVGTQSTVATAATGPAGLFAIRNVPVGRYRIVVDEGTVPDSLRVLGIDSATVTVAADDSVGVSVRTSYPTATTAAARDMAPGARFFVNGVVTSAWPTFGDSTVHLRDAEGSIRATRTDFSNAAPGDAVRLLGTRSTRDGQPTATFARVYVIAPGEPPVPQDVQTVAAAAASNGTLDAALVRIRNAEVLQASTMPSGDMLLIVDDGSGELRVLLDRRSSARITLPPPDEDTGRYPVRLDATGVLVPVTAGAGWQLKPRVQDDLVVAPAGPPGGG
jgi:hypothetical protein